MHAGILSFLLVPSAQAIPMSFSWMSKTTKGVAGAGPPPGTAGVFIPHSGTSGAFTPPTGHFPGVPSGGLTPGMHGFDAPPLGPGVRTDIPVPGAPGTHVPPGTSGGTFPGPARAPGAAGPEGGTHANFEMQGSTALPGSPSKDAAGDSLELMDEPFRNAPGSDGLPSRLDNVPEGSDSQLIRSDGDTIALRGAADDMTMSGSTGVLPPGSGILPAPKPAAKPAADDITNAAPASPKVKTAVNPPGSGILPAPKPAAKPAADDITNAAPASPKVKTAINPNSLGGVVGITLLSVAAGSALPVILQYVQGKDMAKMSKEQGHKSEEIQKEGVKNQEEFNNAQLKISEEATAKNDAAAAEQKLLAEQATADAKERDDKILAMQQRKDNFEMGINPDTAEGMP